MIPHHGTEWSTRTALVGALALAGIALASLGGAATHGLVGVPRPARVVEERSLPVRLAAVDARI